MALNLNALKGLFSKLKPAAKTIANYGDDAARAVANYGDDAARALTTYGDDVMRFANDIDEHLRPYHLYDSIVQHGANPDKLDKLLGTTKYSDVFSGKASHDGLFSLSPPDGGAGVASGAIDYVDDFGIRYRTMQDLDNIGRALPVDVESDFLDAVYDDPGHVTLESPGLDIHGKKFHWPTDNSPQSQLKARLMDKRSPAAWDVRDISPLPSAVEGSIDASQAFDNFTKPGGFWGGVPSTTSVLGDVRGSIAAEDIVPGGIASTYVQVPEIPTAGLVMQDTTGLGVGYLDEFGLRPHKNTALGKWFAKQVPSYRWDVNPFEKPPF